MDNLRNLHKQITASLPLAGSRQLGDGQTVQELQAEAAFAAAMLPVLDELYRWPLVNGTENIPEGDREAITAWLMEQYRDPAAVAALIFVLTQHFRQGFNVGGNLALQELGLPGNFNLTNEQLLTIIEETAESYADVDAEISLTRTTANELGMAIDNGRNEGLEAAALAAFLATYINGRTLARSSNIAATETVNWSRKALGETYDRNGVEFMIYRTAPEASQTGPCPICEPWEGERLRASNGTVWFDLIPQHVGCVCYYEPDVEDWTEPEEVWQGE